jgi:hypothetical protein
MAKMSIESPVDAIWGHTGRPGIGRGRKNGALGEMPLSCAAGTGAISLFFMHVLGENYTPA